MIVIRATALLATCAVALAACGSSSSSDRSVSRAPLAFRAGQLGPNVDNPWFPLPVGRRLVYLGVKEGQQTRNVTTVTGRTRTIQGVSCREVDDRLFVNGRLAESTLDWYAQDRQGNVWYCGEATKELDERGRVTSTEGSWQAGVDGARAGIIMLANPRPGASYRQEYYRGHAEDRAAIVAVGRSLRVAFRPFSNVLVTLETTRLEPSVREHKYYGRGVGIIREVAGPGEHDELVSVTPS